MSTTIANPQAEQATLAVDGMNCASCVAHVEKAALRVAGVQHSAVNLAMGKAVVKFDPAQTSPQRIAQAITDAGYPSQPQQSAGQTTDERRLHRQREEARGWFRRAMLGLLLWFPIEITHWITYFFTGHHESPHVDWMTWVSFAAGTIAIVFIGSAFFRSAYKSLRSGTTNMDVLISMGAGVAYVYSLVALFGHLKLGWPLPHLYFMESAGLLALISLGHWLEARARDSAGSAIRGLMNLAPATARKIDGPNQETSIPVSELKIDDRILVKPGDRIPIDGIVFAGRSSVDESMISGEPIPVTRSAGDQVIGGTINLDGALQINVSKVGSETALAQIIKLVEEAQTSKPQVQKLADRISAVFVPAVLGIALITGIGWYVYGSAVGLPPAQLWGKLANAVCSVLIIACPCALGLAVPAAIMVGTGRGAQRGILIRDIDAIQNAEKIDTVVLDKTGTITEGRPAVRLVTVEYEHDTEISEDELLTMAAAAEMNSSHPLGQSIVAAARRRNLQLPDVEDFRNEPGHGVVATVNGRRVAVGNAKLMSIESAAQFIENPPSDARNGNSISMVAIDGTVIGEIQIGDEVKADSIRSIKALRSLEMQVILLSGDNEAAARAVAAAAGISDVRANVSPAEKAAVIRELQNRKPPIGNQKSHVAMVGDGINDAAALAAADLGIAIGSGSDIAKEAGDIVLVSGSLTGVPAAINLSRATMRKIRQNLFFAFLYNVLAIPLAAFGVLNPMIAAGAMALSDVTVIGNALLLRRAKID